MILRFYMLNFRALRTSKNFKSHWCPPCGQNVTSPEGILPGWLCPLCHILLDFLKYVRMDSSLHSHASSVRRHFPPDIFEVPSMAGKNEKMTEMTWWMVTLDLTQNDAWNVCYKGIPSKTDEWSCNVIIRELLAESEIPHDLTLEVRVNCSNAGDSRTHPSRMTWCQVGKSPSKIPPCRSNSSGGLDATLAGGVA